MAERGEPVAAVLTTRRRWRTMLAPRRRRRRSTARPTAGHAGGLQPELQRHPLPDAPAESDLAADPTADDREAARSLARCVSIFVARLPSPYREAVTLVEFEGLTVRELDARQGDRLHAPAAFLSVAA